MSKSIARRCTTRSTCLADSLVGQFKDGIVQKILADLLALGLGHVVSDAFDHLLAKGVANFLFADKTQVFEKFRGDLGQFQPS